MAKQLIIKQQEITVKDLDMRNLPTVFETERIFDVFDKMNQKNSHICLILNEKNQPIGICTMEDVIEEFIQGNIVDEFDHKDIDQEKQFRVSIALERLGLEGNLKKNSVENSTGKSVDQVLKRKDDHPLTKEIRNKENWVVNPQSGRVSIDQSRSFNRRGVEIVPLGVPNNSVNESNTLIPTEVKSKNNNYNTFMSISFSRMDDDDIEFN